MEQWYGAPLAPIVMGRLDAPGARLPVSTDPLSQIRAGLVAPIDVAREVRACCAHDSPGDGGAPIGVDEAVRPCVDARSDVDDPSLVDGDVHAWLSIVHENLTNKRVHAAVSVYGIGLAPLSDVQRRCM